jgi:hypothetical protein
MRVKIGRVDGTCVTLLAQRITDEMANTRKRQLKETACGTPSKKVLELLSWSIYFTSIEEDEIDMKEIFELYRLRWRIEIIFKAMKSHLHLDKIHNIPVNQLKFIVTGKMILLLIIIQFIYEKVSHTVYKKTGKQISLMKLVRYLKDNIRQLIILLAITKNKKIKFCQNLLWISKYCTYENRKKRETYEDQLKSICLS